MVIPIAAIQPNSQRELLFYGAFVCLLHDFFEQHIHGGMIFGCDQNLRHWIVFKYLPQKMSDQRTLASAGRALQRIFRTHPEDVLDGREFVFINGSAFLNLRPRKFTFTGINAGNPRRCERSQQKGVRRQTVNGFFSPLNQPNLTVMAGCTQIPILWRRGNTLCILPKQREGFVLLVNVFDRPLLTVHIKWRTGYAHTGPFEKQGIRIGQQDLVAVPLSRFHYLLDEINHPFVGLEKLPRGAVFINRANGDFRVALLLCRMDNFVFEQLGIAEQNLKLVGYMEKLLQVLRIRPQSLEIFLFGGKSVPRNES